MDILGFEKLLYHGERLRKLERSERQFPVHATVSLGNYCNHACLWCTAYEAQQDKANTMDADRLLKWLAQAADRGLRAVGYVGNGEPTAHPRFKEIVHAVREMGLQQGMFTNGSLLDRVRDEVLSSFTYIRISLDAGSSAMHARMHDVSATHYERIVESLRDIVAHRKDGHPTIGIQYAVHHDNVGDLEASCKMAAEVGVDYFSIKPVYNRGSVGLKIRKNKLVINDLAPQVADLRKVYESPQFNIAFRPHQVMSEAANHTVLEYDRCVAATFNVGVYEDGSLVGCGPHHVKVGTLDDDLDDVEARILELADKLDLSHCPAGCRYHALNHLVDTLAHPERAQRYHINFL